MLLLTLAGRGTGSSSAPSIGGDWSMQPFQPTVKQSLKEKARGIDITAQKSIAKSPSHSPSSIGRAFRGMTVSRGMSVATTKHPCVPPHPPCRA